MTEPQNDKWSVSEHYLISFRYGLIEGLDGVVEHLGLRRRVILQFTPVLGLQFCHFCRQLVFLLRDL